MSFVAGSSGPAGQRPVPRSGFGRLLRFCLDQLSGMRISFGSGGHEQKLTLTFSFLSSLIASVILLAVLWACGAGWIAGSARYAKSWGEMSGTPDNLFVYLVHVAVATAMILGAWLVDVLEAVGAALLVFLAAASVGAAVGFLFGVPRPLSESGPGAASAAAAASSGSATPAVGTSAAAPAQTVAQSPGIAATPGWYANTNLTQVSDWLTKIIVGVGLVEAGNVATAAKSIDDYVVPKLFEGAVGAAVIVPALMLIGLIVGFMYCYLFTQLFLAALMVQAADEVSLRGNFSATQPLAYAELARIPPAAPVVAPAIRDPRSAAPVRKAQDATPEQTIAATQVQAVPLENVEDPASLAVWSRAGAVLDEYTRAAAGYAKLLTKVRTPDILAEAARVFASAQNFEGARQLIDEASGRLAAARPDTRARIAFDAAHMALHDRPPQGYTRALDILGGNNVLAQDDGGGLHVLHACALGQQYGLDGSLTANDKTRIRQTVLDDLRFALTFPDNLPWVLYLLGRNVDRTPALGEPGAVRDDDLFPFKDDPEFLALVGIAPPARTGSEAAAPGQ